MTITVNINIQFPQLARLSQALDDVNRGLVELMTDLSALTAQVKANTDLEASAVTLIQGIAAQLKAAQDDPAAVAALATQLQTSATALAAALTANTPQDPEFPTK